LKKKIRGEAPKTIEEFREEFLRNYHPKYRRDEKGKK